MGLWYITYWCLLVQSISADSNRREVTEADVEQFQLSRRPLIVLPIANVNGPRLVGDEKTPDGRAGIAVRPLIVLPIVNVNGWPPMEELELQ